MATRETVAILTNHRDADLANQPCRNVKDIIGQHTWALIAAYRQRGRPLGLPEALRGMRSGLEKTAADFVAR